MKDIGIQAKVLVDMLKEKSYKITTAESCTGGLVAAEIVSVAGASNVFEEGYITYSDDVKEKVLGVKRETLKEYTAVSRQVAEQMAMGALEVSGAELALSTTGYAGPDDAEDGTPAGTVYIGACFKNSTNIGGLAVSDGCLMTAKVKKFKFEGDREQVRCQAALEAILLAVEILKND